MLIEEVMLLKLFVSNKKNLIGRILAKLAEKFNCLIRVSATHKHACGDMNKQVSQRYLSHAKHTERGMTAPVTGCLCRAAMLQLFTDLGQAKSVGEN